jgi:hypothetical protein
VEVRPGSVGLAQECADDHQQESSSGEDPRADNDLTVTGELVEFLVQTGVEVGGYGPYNVHGEAPACTSCWSQRVLT